MGASIERLSRILLTIVCTGILQTALATADVRANRAGIATAALGREQSSQDALRGASDNSYYNDGDTLWVKVFASTAGAGGPADGNSVNVSR